MSTILLEKHDRSVLPAALCSNRHRHSCLLPDREFLSGLAEVVKYGLCSIAHFFEWQEKNIESIIARDESAIIYAIEKSCLNKAEVVSLDEREGGTCHTESWSHFWACH